MKCGRCGAQMPEGMLRCQKCGAEIRIVPDYNPLDEVLAAQVKGSIDGTEKPLDSFEPHREDSSPRKTKKEENRLEKPQMRHIQPAKNSTRSENRSEKSRTKQESGRTQPARRPLTPEEKRRRALKKRALKRKRRIRSFLFFLVFLLALIIISVVAYQFSYNGQVKKGNKALMNKNYAKAEECFKKAIKKNPTKQAAYDGLTTVYLLEDKAEEAEILLLKAVDDNPDSYEVYKACFDFYIQTERQGEIPLILDGAGKSVTEKLSDYACTAPTFSLDDEAVYDDVQQLSLESSEDTIYYTTDGSNPFTSGTKTLYEEPIQIQEGDTDIMAISVNKKGIPSLTVKKSYSVELPIVDAPAVSPSTGQYDTETQITIEVPEGYTAYYTMDGSEPDGDSYIYSEPIDMPEGSTIFKAVLMNAKGRLSGVTTRNYELTTY